MTTRAQQAPPPADPVPVRASGMLDVGGGHLIHWEDSGNPDGVPVLHLHGGPGGGLGKGGYRRRCDPARARLVGIDQRGCGRSVPSAATPGYDLAQNTTAHLLADLEAVREHLGIDAWVLSGVSWGSTLALAYALEHPERVLGVALMAVTTTRRFEVDWITESVGAIYPEAWHRFAEHAREAGVWSGEPGERIVEAYLRLLTDPDPAVVEAAALAWCEWEDHHISIGTGGMQAHLSAADPQRRLAFARLVTHYWAHDGFLDPPLLERMAGGALADIPAVLVHGRLDVSGPAVTAWDVHRAWPGSRLVLEEREGHGGPAMAEAWDAAVAHLVDLAAGGEA